MMAKHHPGKLFGAAYPTEVEIMISVCKLAMTHIPVEFELEGFDML